MTPVIRGPERASCAGRALIDRMLARRASSGSPAGTTRFTPAGWTITICRGHVRAMAGSRVIIQSEPIARRRRGRAAASLLLIALLAPAPSLAVDTGIATQVQQSLGRGAAVEPAPPPATLRFFNRDIVTFRAAYFGLSPAERAVNGAQRVRDALATGGPGDVKMLRTAEGINVSVDGAYVFRILEGDLDADDGQTFDQAQVIVGGRDRK